MSFEALPSAKPGSASPDAASAYLHLLKQVLTRFIGQEEFAPVIYNKRSWQEAVFAPLKAAMATRGYLMCQRVSFDPVARTHGTDWPASAETMAGLKRLDNVQACVEQLLADRIEGDFIETGVWRGGSSILMRAVLKAYGITDRKVWLADSFAGLPKSSHPEDLHWDFERYRQLAVSLEQVQDNFRKYGLLDEQVGFIKGWFKDTLSTAPVGKLALLRLDGDLYESTWDAIVPLYPKLSVGGYILIDDYGGIDSCRKAITDYREKHGITEPIHAVDQSGVFWRKQR